MLVACVAAGRVTKSAGMVLRFTVSATQGIKLLVESMFVSQTGRAWYLAFLLQGCGLILTV